MALILPFTGLTHAAFPLQQDPVFTELPRIPYFFSLAPERGLEKVLDEPYHIFLEVGEYHTLDASLMQILSSAPDFALSLTTPTAYHHQTAHAVSEQLHRRFGTYAQSMQIATCLHEALISSLIYANCAIETPVKSAADFDAHYATIASRLTQAPYKDRRVSILFWNKEQHVTLGIANQGQGFTSATQNQPLFLIQRFADKVWIGEDERTLFMNFTH